MRNGNGLACIQERIFCVVESFLKSEIFRNYSETFPVILVYEARMFINMFTWTRHFSQSPPRWIKYTLFYPISLLSVLILSSVYACNESVSFKSLYQNYLCIPILSYECNRECQLHSFNLATTMKKIVIFRKFKVARRLPFV